MVWKHFLEVPHCSAPTWNSCRKCATTLPLTVLRGWKVLKDDKRAIFKAA